MNNINKVTVKYKNNDKIKPFRVSIDDPRYLSGELVSANTGVKMKHKICPHCGKEGRGGNMTRYHFDNCKYKP